MEITQEIYQVGGGRLTSPEDAAVYLINFGGPAALVDAGTGQAQARLLANIRACGVNPEQIEYLLITHCHYDHTGGVKTLKDLLSCQVVAHELEAPFLEQGDNRVTAATWYGARITPFSIDLKISGKQGKILLGGRVILALHLPGHSPGSMVYVTESAGKKVLFGQDVHGPIHPDLKSDPEDYQRSLQMLLALDADILCEGHYGVYSGKKRVADFIRGFMTTA
jgi:glyoxylase-like metal-dependent hydrolase (beta-lactamase superfamily II)|uniref:MBL fold metallo-hydrolase n=1 Tax=Desulfobacca acetoxidans TaxID=60893 RepID=A0A7C3Z2S6_9BACT